MVGAIRTWDILSHPIVTIQCFGWRVFFKAIMPWPGKTFLGVLRDYNLIQNAHSQVPEILERCIALELQARLVYVVLAKALSDMPSATRFFRNLAREEQDHADLLEVCRLAADRGRWEARHFLRWQDYIPRLEQQMQAAEASLTQIDSVYEALRLVLQIESSEVNQVFKAVVASADSAFVKKLRPFQAAMDDHIAHISRQIPKLAPNLTPACKELRERLLSR